MSTRISEIRQKYAVSIVYIVAVLLSGFMFIAVTSQNVSMDEGFTIMLVREDIKGIIAGTASDVHPPLYYLLLKLTWLFGGESWINYRLMTIIPTALNLIWLGATNFRKEFGNRAALYYLCWFGISGSTFNFSNFIRMYSWGAFFVMAAAQYVWRYYHNEKKKDWVLGIIFTLLAMYTHFYALLAVFFVWVLLLAGVWIKKRENVLRVIGGGVIITIGYLPWLSSMLKQSGSVATNYWLKVFDWKSWFLSPATLAEYDYGLKGSGIAVFVVMLCLFVLAVFMKNKAALFSITVFVSVMLSGALLSVLITPIWMERYLYMAWGLFAAFAAIVMSQMPVKPLTHIVSFGFFFVLAVCLLLNVQKSELLNQNSDADELYDFARNIIEDDAVLIADDHIEHYQIVKSYFPEQTVIMTEAIAKDTAKMENLLAQFEGRQMWYAINYAQPELSVETVDALLNECGYELVWDKNYSIFDKNIDMYSIRELEP